MFARANKLVAGAILGGAVALSGCELLPPSPGLPGVPGAQLPGGPTARSAESVSLSKYYGRVQETLLTQGLLRQDGGGPDVPFTERNLVDNFVRIALFEEYATVGGRVVARQTASQLHKWVAPVRMKVDFGASIPEEQRAQDRRNVGKYTARLSKVTGLPIRQVSSDANFHVFIVNEDERRELGPRIKQLLPQIGDPALRTVIDMSRSTFCLVFALDPGDTGAYTQALAVIRGEHPDLMRLSCIHEELAQGLGLSNDSPRARPSVFNDDEEFGLLTTHDELLLRMLYDARMQPGMAREPARNLAETIAAELLSNQI